MRPTLLLAPLLSASRLATVCLATVCLAAPCLAQTLLVGDARELGSTIRLTRAQGDLGGALWRAEKQTLASGFETRFRFRISEPGGLNGGADGFAFVIQNHGNRALGGYGGAGGFASGDGIHNGAAPGIPLTLAVFFDTHRNREAADPSGNFLTVSMNGHPGDVRWPPKRLAVVEKLPFKLKDGKEHRAHIRYQPPLLVVYLDERKDPLLHTVVDLSPVLDADGMAYVGFTASTGGGWANHDILEWDWRPAVSSSISVVTSNITFASYDCLPDRNLCTPREPRVTPLQAGRYRIALPAHLRAGAAIPNPRNLPVHVVTAAGIVCAEPATAAPPACFGPADHVTVQTHAGQSTFTIDGIARPHQGFFELEVELPPAFGTPR